MRGLFARLTPSRYLCIVACLYGVLAVALIASVRAQADFAGVDKLFQDFVSVNHVPGAVWAIIVDGKLVHTGATGYRELAGKTTPNADTVFRIANPVHDRRPPVLAFDVGETLRADVAGRVAVVEEERERVHELAK